MTRAGAGRVRLPGRRHPLLALLVASLGVLLVSPAVARAGGTRSSVAPMRPAAESTAAVTPMPAVTALAGGAESPSAAAGLVPIAPARVFDTRPGEVALVNAGAALGPRATIVVDVVQPLGIAPAEIGGVALNVTVDQPTGAGFLTVWPDGERPVASTLNFVAGQTVPNGIVVGVDADGHVRIHNGSDGAVHVVVDLNGWIPVGAGFTPLAPARALETRVGEPGHRSTRALGADGRVTVDLAAFIPDADRADATAVTVNLTATNVVADTYLTLYPAGRSQPGTSSLNARRGDTVANSAVVGLGDAGQIVVYNHVGTTDVVLDVTGYFARGQSFRALSPQRLIDTRRAATAALGPGASGFLKIDELASLPRGFVGAVAVNVTAATSTGTGFLTVWPSSSARPTASSVNFVPGRIASNTVIVGVDQNAYLSVYNSAGTTDVVVDITGWFPQDALGLVADGREARRYTVGGDLIGLVHCRRTADPQNDAAGMAALASLADATTYYRWLSGGRYEPQFTYLGTGPYNGSDLPFVPCRPLGATFPDGLRGVLYDVPSTSPNGASGLAGPGVRCSSVDCSSRSTWPDNQRNGRVSSNSLVAEAPAAVPWFSVPVHELGHMLDWPHSYTGTGPVASTCSARIADGVCEYDNPVDLMSRVPTLSASPTPTDFADLQATLAINRYAAGWLSPSAVAVHGGVRTTYRLVAKGGRAVDPAGKELLVLPTEDPAAYITAEVRVKAVSWDPDLARYDGTLAQEGVAIHVVDQRAAVGCPAVGVAVDPLDRCSGLGRRTAQYAARPNTYDHVIPVGQTVTIGSMQLTVSTGVDGRFDVTVSGGPYALAPVANAVVTADAAGQSYGSDPTPPLAAAPPAASVPVDQLVDASAMAPPAGTDLVRAVRRSSAAS